MKLKSISIALLVIASATSFLSFQPKSDVMERGKKLYQSECLACHQADGKGVSRLAPTLVKTPWVLGDKKVLIDIVLNGVSGLEVEGEYFYNPMPDHSRLTDKEIADVLTFVRNSFGNKASPVSSEEVKQRRLAKKK
jgi:mono/diheme cytochrome c family protein